MGICSSAEGSVAAVIEYAVWDFQVAYELQHIYINQHNPNHQPTYVNFFTALPFPLQHNGERKGVGEGGGVHTAQISA